MAVDVSVYNEIAKNNNCLAQNISAAASAYSTNYSVGYNCGIAFTVAVNTTGQTCQQAIYPTRLACDLIAQPWCCCYWAAIPTLPSVTGGVLVCDTGAGFGGVSCIWTVPATAQFIRFQMWGAGAASMPTCCCGMSINGGSGAYASVILPAIAGCQYTLCAGCALVGARTSNSGSGCASYVTGYGLNNVCAEGGEHNLFCWLKRKMAVNGVDDPNFASVCRLFPNPLWACSVINKGTTPTSYCLCSNGGFCSGSPYITSGTTPFVTSCKMFYGNVTNPTQCCHFVIGTPGAWPQLNGIVSSFNFCMTAPPVTCITACCPVPFSNGCVGSGGSCSGWSLYSCPCQRSDNAPGRGGIPAMSSAGEFYCGFPGTGGAVCVQYL